MVAAVLLGAAPQASAANPGEWVFDLVILRPSTLVATVGGSVLFAGSAVVLAPFDFFAGNWGRDWPRVNELAETFVIGPGAYTFQRPIGEF
jgi:hypothetical protein